MFEAVHATNLSVQASFTIPCSTTTTTSSSSSSHNEKNTFPVLPRYERTAGPSDLRRQGYLSSCKKSRHAFEVSSRYFFSDKSSADIGNHNHRTPSRAYLIQLLTKSINSVPRILFDLLPCFIYLVQPLAV